MIKMIVCDLDRTLLDSNKKILQENIDSLLKAQKQGVVLVLASGRNYYGMEAIYDCLQMDTFKTGYVVGVNGLQLYDFSTKKLDILESLKDDDVKYIKSVAKKLKYVYFGLRDDASFISGNRFIQWLFYRPFFQKKFLSSSYDGRLPNPSFTSYDTTDECLNKICLQSLKFYFARGKRLKKYLKNYQVMNVSPGWFEVVPNHLNKAVRVEEIMLKHQIQQEEVLVFGDSENDIEMLKVTENSYAMNNAFKSTKKVSNHVIGDHNTACISEVINSFL